MYCRYRYKELKFFKIRQLGGNTFLRTSCPRLDCALKDFLLNFLQAAHVNLFDLYYGPIVVAYEGCFHSGEQEKVRRGQIEVVRGLVKGLLRCQSLTTKQLLLGGLL